MHRLLPVRGSLKSGRHRIKDSGMTLSEFEAGPQLQALLDVRSICRTYDDGTVRALKDVSFTVNRGEYVAIMGPSGSGKSTLLNLLGALDHPCRGEIRFEGQSLARMHDLDRFRARTIG